MNDKKAVNEEINLLELVMVIWKRKYWIAAFVVLCSVAGVFYALSLDNIFESKAVLKPSNSSGSSSGASKLKDLAGVVGVNLGQSSDVHPYYAMKAILNDNEFLAGVVKKYNFESNVVENYNEIPNKANFNKNYKYNITKDLKPAITFTFDENSGMLNISYQNKDREFARKFLNVLLYEMSEKNKAVNLENVQDQINNYKRELEITSDISLKVQLSSIIADLIQNRVLSQAQKYYGFTVLVEPSVPNELERVRPKRAIMCIAISVSSAFVAVFAALIAEWILTSAGRLREEK